MSRSQQGNVIGQATGQANTYNTEAQTSFNTAQQDLTDESKGISDYGSALAGFKAANPYGAGGEFETATNKQLADTAAGGAQAAGQGIQSAAVRTGQNAGGAIAATEQIAENNQRQLAGEEAGATQQRLAAGTGYGQAVLGGTATKEGMQAGLAGQQAGLAGAEGGLSQGALGIEEKVAQTPSFMDELGQGIIQSGVGFASGAGKGYGQTLGSGGGGGGGAEEDEEDEGDD